MSGMMCGLVDCIAYVEKTEDRGDGMKQRVLNRLSYMDGKENGIRPKFHKGIYGHKYDSWTCGNCGTTLKRGVLQNFCDNCGFMVKWDSPRCLTGYNEDAESQEACAG